MVWSIVKVDFGNGMLVFGKGEPQELGYYNRHRLSYLFIFNLTSLKVNSLILSRSGSGGSPQSRDLPFQSHFNCVAYYQVPYILTRVDWL